MKSRIMWLRHTSPVIVIGMHRSGTSMLTRQLHAVGVHMGQDQSENAESHCFQELNRRILDAAGGSWSQILPVLEKMQSGQFVRQQVGELAERLFRGQGIRAFLGRRWQLKLELGFGPRQWGWKDPRNSITLPVWLSIFPGAKVIHVIRNGVDVAISLHRRETKRSSSSRDYSPDCLDFGYCFQLWEQYVRACREHIKLLPAERCLELLYEQMLDAPREYLSLVLSFLGHRVSDRKLHRVASTVDRSRLANDENRRQYLSEIASLQPSPLMMELSYV